MKTTKKLSKNFSCLEMKRQIQAKIYAETKDMTTEELLAYFNEQNSFRKTTPQHNVPTRRVSLREKKEFA